MEEERLTPREAVDFVLSEYGQRYGQNFRLDDKGNCALQFGMNVAVGVEVPEESDLALVYAPIAPLPFGFEARDDVFQAVLSRNLGQQMLDGGAIALDPDGGLLVYAISQKVDELTPGSLDAMFEAAITTVIEVRDEIGFDPETVALETAAEAAGADENDSADTLVKV